MSGYLKLGDLLVAEGLITNLQLSAVLTAQKTSKRRLGDLLVDKGLVSEDQIAECLASQYGYPLANLASESPSADALALIEPEVALSYGVLPLRTEPDCFYCAISDPLDIVATDFISQLVQRRLSIVIAPKSALLDAINAAYSGTALATGAQILDVPFPPERYKDVRARRRIASVAMFDAFDSTLGRQVTLSASRSGSDEDRTHSALVRACARATAKSICAVHDCFEHNGYRFTVFESLEGETLAHVIASRGPRSVMQAAEMVAELAEGLDILNRAGGRAGIVSPENILIRWNGALLAPLTTPGPEYACPEGNSHELSACDTFALGTLLWESITASNPHGASVVTSGGKEIWADPRKAKNLPTALKDILNNCLGLDPRERYATTFQLANALRSYNWGSATLSLSEGGAHEVVSSRDREELLELITVQEEHSREPFWKRWFGRKAA